MDRRGLALTIPSGAILIGAILIGACGGDSAACTELREPADPLSFTHVIDPSTVSYPTHPPTSGPHVAVATPSGVVDEPILPAVQVRILETGGALIQWSGVDENVREELERLAVGGTVVAPGSDLPAPIVATAWTWKLTCRDLDVAALTRFVESRPSSAPGRD